MSLSIVKILQKKPILNTFNKSIERAVTNISRKEEEQFSKSYQDALNLCFSEKPILVKFNSNSTDEDIDRFFDSL